MPACPCPPCRSSNSLSGVIPDDWQSSGLVSLDLSSNLLSLAANGSLPLPPTLASLHLENNLLYGPFPSNLANLTSLRLLSMPRCGLSGSLPATPLPPLLDTLWLDQNSLTGTIPWDAWHLPDSLTWLSVFHNRLSGPLPNALPTSLTHFDVSYNALDGSLPAELLAQLPPALELFYANDNRLTGTLPQAQLLPIGSASGQLSVDWSNNSLSGPVPTAWSLRPGEAPAIQVWLGGNQLNGTLPADTSLLALDVVDLSFNRLTGAAGGVHALLCLFSCPRVKLNKCPCVLPLPSLPCRFPAASEHHNQRAEGPSAGDAAARRRLLSAGKWGGPN